MIESSIKILIVKYCNNQINVNEIKTLNKWVKKGNNKIVFQQYIALNYNIEQVKELNSLNKEQAWDFIETQITPRKKTLYWKYAIAASIALFISVSFFLSNKTNQSIITPIIINNVETGTDKAILTLEDGNEIALEKGRNYQTENLTSDGKTLIYSNTNKVISEISYNYLTIPRGGQYYIKLADGTEVWLNSESQLKYPVKFIEEEPRIVELVYGEAYFDVSPSSQNKGSKFIVNTQMQEIQVVGTEFNIKAYLNEDIIYTTLVEGKVLVNNDDKNVVLNPGKQSKINTLIKDGNIIIVEVDVESEISWKKGMFSFKNKSLKEIMKVLSRWYDIDVVFSNKELENIHFKGVLKKNQNIEEILLTIKNIQSINAYEINDKKVTIK